jgi:hypothetical protein
VTTTFLTGPAGTGKTTYAITRLRELLINQVPGYSILVLVPHLTLAGPYQALLRDPALPGASAVDVLSLNGLALQTIDLFWPLVAERAGFKRPQARPIFMNIETAQYYLRQVIDPLLKQGYFDPNVVPITISLPRLMSQILDNLNKAAQMGLPHTQVGQRLATSLAAEPSGRVALEHAQTCINEFRNYCLAHNLLDFSLRIETFYQHLWPVEGIRQYLTRRYRHLIIDNLEEDSPFAHTILRDWLASTESALLISDEDAGYRIFLGANWRTAQKLADLADETLRFTESQVASPDILALGKQLEQILLNERVATADRRPPSAQPSPSASPKRRPLGTADQGLQYQKDTISPRLSDRQSNLQSPIPKGHDVSNLPSDPRRVITFQQERFYPQMITWVIDRIEALLAEGVPPEEIIVLAPFVSDALRFSFTHRMAQRGLPARSHRPSRPLSEEPAAKTVLTLARLAFPEMGLLPEPFDVAQTLSQAIADLDLIRANLLTQVVYRPDRRLTTADRRPPTADGQLAIDNSPLTIHNSQFPLTPFDQIEGSVRERISYQAGNRFDQLRAWLQNVPTESPEGMALDHFLNRLFDEILGQPGFGFHNQQEASEIIANLIDSARKFRRVAELVPTTTGLNAPKVPSVQELNRAYLETIELEFMAAQYLRGWDSASESAVLITPATTFLMSNRPVDYQFWLDAGSSGWWENIAQPLTHPYVLTSDWEPGRPWTDADEVANQRDRLSRLVLGLTRRCRKHIFIANAEAGEQGYEQRGQLLIVLQQMLRQISRERGEM